MRMENCKGNVGSMTVKSLNTGFGQVIPDFDGAIGRVGAMREEGDWDISSLAPSQV